MIQIANKEDANCAIDVLVASYNNAPNISWMFTQSQSKLRNFFSFLIWEAVAKNSVYLTSDKCGVLILESQGLRHFSLRTILTKIHLILFVVGVKNSLRIVRLNQMKRKVRPNKGFYASVLAIRKHKSRWNTILELKRGFSNIAKELYQPVYLETTNPRTLQLYEKLGFTKYHEMQHPYTNLKIYFMKLSPL